MDKIYDVLVVGVGPAGISSAIYANRKGLTVGIIGKGLGGQVTSTTEIENIIGIQRTTGFEYSQNLKKHLESYNIDIYDEMVEKIENGSVKKVVTNKSEYFSKTIIIATGAKHRKLNVEGENEYIGKGVHYCSTCDAPFYRGLDVAVVGGGNSGVEAAIELSNIAKNVTLIEFQDKLKADSILVEKIKNIDNISVLVNTKTEKILGSDFVTNVEVLNMKDNVKSNLNLDGIFVEIGLSPETEFVDGLLELNNLKEIVVDRNNQTSIEGIFAAGDCTNVKYKQIVIAVGEGAKAALSVFDYLVKL